MIKTREPNTTAPAAGQLFCLVRLGDGDGIRPAVKTDLTLRVPFSIDPGWYAAHWYGGRSGPITREPGSALKTIRAVMRWNAEIVCLGLRKAGFSARRAAAETRAPVLKSF